MSYHGFAFSEELIIQKSKHRPEVHPSSYAWLGFVQPIVAVSILIKKKEKPFLLGVIIIIIMYSLGLAVYSIIFTK